MNQQNSAAEVTYFEHQDVKVTSSRFVSARTSYAIRNVTSVGVERRRSTSAFLWIAIAALGMICMLEAPWVGGVLLTWSIWKVYSGRPAYHVILTTAAGETSALRTYQLDYVESVIGALNKAMAAR